MNIFRASEVDLYRNVISGNFTGVLVSSAMNAPDVPVRIRANKIGTNAEGDAAPGNRAEGIRVQGSSNVQIGGPEKEDGNTIAGNPDGGSILGSFAITAQYNLIGTNRDGQNLGNLGAGLGTASSSDVRFLDNEFWFNKWGVITTGGSTKTLLRRNSFVSNMELPYDRDFDGVTATNRPVITGATTTSAQGMITGSANTSYTIELFSTEVAHSSGSGEGKTPLGTTTVMTDGTGKGTFSMTGFPAVTSRSFVTATATEGDNDTFEFSAAFPVP